MTQNNLGNALNTLGERESSAEALQRAVRAYELALEERTRERVPLDWSCDPKQSRRCSQYPRRERREGGTETLQRAVRAYELALEELTRERVLRWTGLRPKTISAARSRPRPARAAPKPSSAPSAPTGWRWKERTRACAAGLGHDPEQSRQCAEASASARAAQETLQRAVCYGLALEEWLRRVPLDWARTQNNLGSALLALGQRESGTTLNAPSAPTGWRWRNGPERVPLDWAGTQNNLSAARSGPSASRENGTATLLRAVRAYGLALEERTRERLPLRTGPRPRTISAIRSRSWASARAAPQRSSARSAPTSWRWRNGPASACRWTGPRPRTISATRSDPIGRTRRRHRTLQRAVRAYELALEEWTRERVPLDWAMTLNNLGSAL
ncbi:MAG: hypothetical protein R3D25_17895 [Geminicoccaceae bacterium]